MSTNVHLPNAYWGSTKTTSCDVRIGLVAVTHTHIFPHPQIIADACAFSFRPGAAFLPTGHLVSESGIASMRSFSAISSVAHMATSAGLGSGTGSLVLLASLAQ